MKCSVLQQKSTETKRVIQQISMQAVGLKSKQRICVAIHIKSVHESKKDVSSIPISKITALHYLIFSHTNQCRYVSHMYEHN